MNNNGQKITQNAYEDSVIINGYVKKNTLQQDEQQLINYFSKKLTGNKILDLGCGPGRDAQDFSKKGFQVTGLDLSDEMLKRARKLI